jgi:hypothetical protein
MAELLPRLEAELSPAMVRDDGTPATPRSLAEGHPTTGHFLLWVTPPLEGGLSIEARLEAQPVRHELEVVLGAGDPDPGDPARRYFGLWRLPADLPLVTARIEVASPEGAPVRSRYLGPRGGHPVAGHGWVDPREEILRAPPRGMPRALHDIVAPGPPAGSETVVWELVAHGDFSGAVRKAGRHILRGPDEVRREWERLHQGQLAVGPPPHLPTRGEVVVALYQGVLPEARRRHRVVGVWKADAVLVVGVREGTEEAEGGDSPYLWVRAVCPPGTRVEVRPM